MTILKNILKYKYILFILIILLTLIRTNINNKSIYNVNENNFIGIVDSYEYKENYITFILKGKEKLKCNYYINDNKKININYGDKIYLKGTLKEPNNNTIPNTFNYKKYLQNNNIFYTLEIDEIIKLEPTNNIIYKIKNKIQKRLDKIDKTGYLNTFILGNKNFIDNDIYNTYSKNGVLHIFSISGTHISLLASIIFFILNKIKRTNYNTIIVILFLLFYLVLTNFQASITRSIIFFLLLNLFKLKKIKISTLDTLLLAIIIILLINPKFIYNIGFIYSSSISFSLIFYNNKFNKNYILNTLLISLVSFLISLPITINLNYTVNILSILINLIFVPLICFIIYPLSLITFIIPFIYPIFKHLIYITENISNFISNINLFILPIPKLNFITILIYYLLVYISLSKNKKYFLLLILFIFIIKNINKLDTNYYIYYLDVGQGDMSVIKYKNKCIVIDTGGKSWNSTYEITDNHIKFLYSIGINKIDLLILTHGDYDHLGNALYLTNNFKVDKVIFNNGEYNDLELELIKNLKNKNIKYSKNTNNLNLNNIKLYFLNTKNYSEENDNSIVLYSELNNNKLLLMGDASIEVEQNLMNKYNLENIDILKVGHHGSKTSSSENFINYIKPKYSIISVGKNNRYGHPNKEVLQNLKNSNIYRTDKQGSIIFKLKKDKLKIETCSP